MVFTPTLPAPHLLAVAAAGGGDPHPAMILPFGLMLLAIAVMPFLNKGWWEHHYPHVALGLGALVAAYYAFVLGNPGRLLHVAHDYVSFMALIGSLFVVAGGIHIRVRGESTPGVNCVFLLVGALLANVIGTTGASMLLIRPWIRMNKYRITAFHVVFFIFLVSNVGGALTPIGDPPLFLGYLNGVPFLWTVTHLWPAWMTAVLLLLAVFYVLDRANFLRAPRAVREAETAAETWRFEGLGNLGFLAVILGAVFVRHPPGVSEALMIAAAAGSHRLTPRAVHQANDFGFGPIKEVAWLFIGIFATMLPALDYLSLHADQLGLDSPLKLYYLSGSLSSVLDNAPTYLTFLAAAMGRAHLSLGHPGDLAIFLDGHARELAAISLGSVFFGAVTYIGNGPNFMVKSIAEAARVNAPGFFEYLLRYALPILIPVFTVVAWRFLAG